MNQFKWLLFIASFVEVDKELVHFNVLKIGKVVGWMLAVLTIAIGCIVFVLLNKR